MTFRTLLEIVAAAGAACSFGFFLLCGCGIVSFLNAQRRQKESSPARGASLPSVSVLKPLKGVDPRAWECFSSHSEQEYPEFELIFGVSDVTDPAVELVQRLRQKYPSRRIELVVCEKDLGSNAKVSNLIQMLPKARHEVLLVSDSDICVPPGYLRRVIAPLADFSVGLVTCLYRGVASATLGSQLESWSINTDFVPGVLSARVLEKGLRFGLGSTLAFRRSDLAAIGGFEGIVEYLADDYEVGRRIAALGKRVELSDIVVETFLPPYSLRQFFAHQFRWSRTVRGARRWGYAGLMFTFGFVWALALLLVGRGASWAWALAAVTVGARILVAIASGRAVLDDRRFWPSIYLLPMRDLIAPLIWGLSFAGNRISWRGDVFQVKEGRLVRDTRAARE